MTPTIIPRDWNTVDTALAGVIAFDNIDATLTSAEESLPGEKSVAGQVSWEAEPLQADARQRLADVKHLHDETRLRLIEAANEYGTERDLRKHLRRQVFWLRLRLIWLKISTGIGRVGKWLVLALPRLGVAVWRLVNWPFRKRVGQPFTDDDEDEQALRTRPRR